MSHASLREMRDVALVRAIYSQSREQLKQKNVDLRDKIKAVHVGAHRAIQMRNVRDAFNQAVVDNAQPAKAGRTSLLELVVDNTQSPQACRTSLLRNAKSTRSCLNSSSTPALISTSGSPSALGSDGKESRWRFQPYDGLGIGIRAHPGIDAEQVGSTLTPGDVFDVTGEYQGLDGLLYLKIADGRGWAFDHKPNAGIMCVRVQDKDGSIEAAKRSLLSSRSSSVGAIAQTLDVNVRFDSSMAPSDCIGSERRSASAGRGTMTSHLNSDAPTRFSVKSAHVSKSAWDDSLVHQDMSWVDQGAQSDAGPLDKSHDGRAHRISRSGSSGSIASSGVASFVGEEGKLESKDKVASPNYDQLPSTSEDSGLKTQLANNGPWSTGGSSRTDPNLIPASRSTTDLGANGKGSRRPDSAFAASGSAKVSVKNVEHFEQGHSRYARRPASAVEQHKRIKRGCAFPPGTAFLYDQEDEKYVKFWRCLC
eukprot:TRINITY_DN7454_c1_g1_i1.p1 TRINITY_DN7454_c1_g1~~TRINITY_DN7454_c1_g1_i1.p1  ORF type:complete len:479 (-),score=55.77 TRINITY_DN7454_c1_g1_i1:789-2225(-)